MEWSINKYVREENWSLDQPSTSSRQTQRKQPETDFLIIGAGIFGTSTAYHLSKTLPSATVTIVDRSPFPPRHAASTDINKIVRADYSSRFYMDLATEAMEAWLTWPDIKRFYHKTGWINFSAKGSDVVPRIRQNYRERGNDPTRDIKLDDTKKEFGAIFRETDLDGIENAYFNPEAGWCDAGDAVSAMLESALRNPRIRYAIADVERIVLTDDGQAVKGVLTGPGEYLTAKKVLVATGAWTSKLMSTLEDELKLAEDARIERQIVAAGVCVAHFRVSDTQMRKLKEMPVVIYGTAGDGQPPPARSQLLKLTNAGSVTNTFTTATGHKISSPPERDQNTVPEKLKEETLVAHAHKVMPVYTKQPVDVWRLCWDAVSPSQDQLISKHPNPRLSNLFFAVGGSFHSWKFLPTIGYYVMNVLQGKSNGEEKDAHWAWKTEPFEGRGAHEKAFPLREHQDFEPASLKSNL